MRKRLTATLLVLLAVLPAATLHAQRARDTYAAYPHIGLQASLGDNNAGLGIGVRYENRMTGLFPDSPNLRFIGSFDYFFPDAPAHYWEINLDVVNLFTLRNARVAPYAGGGLNIARGYGNGGGNTDAGLNLVGGFRLPGRYRPYLEGRLELGGGDRFVATFGWLFW